MSKLGKLGGFLGFAVTGIIRAMGKAGWEFWECRQLFDKKGINVADNTIRIQLVAGRVGDIDPAPVDKAELAKLRPDPEDNPKAKAKADGEDILTPLIEQAAQAIFDVSVKR